MIIELDLWLLMLVFTIIAGAIAWAMFYLIKKIDTLRKPKVPIRIDKERLDAFIELTHDLTFEERLFIFKTLLGNCKMMISLSDDKIIIDGIGRMATEVDREDITG